MLEWPVLQIQFYSSEYKMIMKPKSYAVPCTTVSVLLKMQFPGKAMLGKTAKELETKAEKKGGRKLHKNSCGEEI